MEEKENDPEKENQADDAKGTTSRNPADTEKTQ
jgi:hypothetical protein